MSNAARLAGFALVLAVALGAGYGVGAAVGPGGSAAQETSVEHAGKMPAGQD
ncbi:hypothetical protein [Georgenia yuyongxinii]